MHIRQRVEGKAGSTEDPACGAGSQWPHFAIASLWFDPEIVPK